MQTQFIVKLMISVEMLFDRYIYKNVSKFGLFSLAVDVSINFTMFILTSGR
jgi:hypothetical protein